MSAPAAQAVVDPPSGQPETSLRLATGPRAWILLLAGLVVAILVFLGHLPFARNTYLFDDSADYYRAAHGQMLETYLNTNSRSPLALYEMRNDPAFRSHPWDALYVEGDNAALRHFHVPFSYYAMDAASRADASPGTQRLLISAVTALTCGALAVGLAAFGAPLVVAVPVGLVAGLQARFTEVSVDPTPHGWYMLFAVLFLFVFALYLRGRRFRQLALAAVLLGFAFATLEFTVQLLATIPIALAALWVEERWSWPAARSLILSLLKAIPIFLLTTFVIWPGGWLRGGYAESYGVLSATVLFKNHEAFAAPAGQAGIYEKLFHGHEGLLLFAGFFVVAGAILLFRRKLSAASAVFGVYALIAFAMGVADHFRLVTYVSEFLLFLFAACGLFYADLFGRGRWMLSRAGIRRMVWYGSGVAVLLVCAQEWSMRRDSFLFRPWLQPIMNGVAREVPKGQSILVTDNLEAFDLYLPGYDFEPTVAKDSGVPRSAERTRQTRYFLFNSTAPAPRGATLLESFPTYEPGRTENLYVAD